MYNAHPKRRKKPCHPTGSLDRAEENQRGEIVKSRAMLNNVGELLIDA
jgi:hypothetical protein